MSLVRWEPLRELEQLSQQMNRFFSRRFPVETTAMEWMPTVDIEETEAEYLIKAELPGIRKEDVKVTCKDGVLAIQGERKQEKEEKGKKFHRIERSYGSFYRSFAIPAEVDTTKIAADDKDGVLLVHLPKIPEKQVKAIEVKIR